MNVGLLGAEDATMLSWLGDTAWVVASVALGLGFVIFVHELGHFLAAKLFGVKVEKFYVGFDVPISLLGLRLPRTLGKFQWGETEYGIGILPLGGYVKMLGQDDDPRRAAEERERIRLAQGTGDGAGLNGATADDEESFALDPRSYPAKSVWQRMVIISAGVVMNLITGILFAAVAFGLGVSYEPAVVGSTIPGYPAWEAGLPHGGRVVTAAGLKNDPKLHFEDMMMEILKAGIDEPEEPIDISIQHDDEVIGYRLKTRAASPDSKRRLIGIGPLRSTMLGGQLAAEAFSSAATVLDKADRGAKITHINGSAIPVDTVVGVEQAADLINMLTRKPGESVRLDLLRQDGSTTSIDLAPQPYKSMGLRFAVGPVSGLVTGGPAARAGLKIGDRIIGLGSTAGDLDAITLPQRISQAGPEVILLVERGEEGASVQREITVQADQQALYGNPVSPASNQVELTGLGLCIELETKVTGLDSVGQALADQVQVGDELQQIAIEWPEKKVPAELAEIFTEQALKLLENGWKIDPSQPLANLIDYLQKMPVGTKVKLTLARGEKKQIVEVATTLQASSDFWYERGLVLTPVRLIHRADSVGEAFSLGLREANRKAADVFGFLRMLFTGDVAMKQVGGPLAIVNLIGTAASDGFSKLLITLTLLSINLAILNFLPIPALDGGHMVFLIAEAVRGKPINEEIQARLTMVGVLGLLSLMVFVLINDYLNIFG